MIFSDRCEVIVFSMLEFGQEAEYTKDGIISRTAFGKQELIGEIVINGTRRRGEG